MRFEIFDNYFLVIDLESNRITVISVKRNVEKILKPVVRSKNLYYSLYKNGQKTEHSLRSLLNLFFR